MEMPTTQWLGTETVDAPQTNLMNLKPTGKRRSREEAGVHAH